MCSPKRDTMHLHNKAILAVVFCFLLSFLVAGSAFAQPQQSQTVKPTPLPSDVHANDPALPVWMKPSAAPVPSTTTSANVPATKPDTNVPTNPQPTSPGRPGEVVKGERGEYRMVKRVENIMLPVTVMDERRH